MSNYEDDIRTFVVSFDNSPSYKVSVVKDATVAFDDLKELILSYINDKFGSLDDANFYDQLKVTEITPENEAEYSGLPYLTKEAVDEIKKSIATEVEKDQSLHELNDNAPFDVI